MSRLSGRVGGSRVLFQPESGAIAGDDDGAGALLGSVLLSNTTACEASRLLVRAGQGSLGGDWASDKEAFRTLDLLSLIDAAVLHERIFVLPASLPDDVGELEFRSRLVEEGVLAPLPRLDDRELIGKALIGAMSTVTGADRPTDEQLDFARFRASLASELGLTEETAETGGADSWEAWHGRPRSTELQEGYDGDEGVVGAVTADSFDGAVRQLVESLDYGVSGAYGEGMTSFRAMFYVFASEHHHLPYHPSVSVARFTRAFPNYFSGAVREKLYERLSSALSEASIAAEFEHDPVFVPPFAALVLDRASTAAEIPAETVALREEYAGFRSTMTELEHERANATTLKARLKATRQIEMLCTEVARQFDQPAQMRLETTMRYIPDAVELASNPTNPAGWASLLLDKPAQALIGWYRRRPVAKLVQAANAVGALEHYDRLLTKHFGEAVGKAALDRQRRLNASS